MTGDGHSGQPFGCQPFSLQPPEAGCQIPMAVRPIPELQMPVPVTRHLNRWRSPALVSLGPPALDSAPCPRVTVPTCPLALME